MRFVINSSQQYFFDHNDYIELESIFSEEDLAVLLAHPGRDTFRTDPSVTVHLHFFQLGQIATQLFKEKRLRVAFTQTLPCYKKTATLEEISSMTGLCGGILINLGVEESDQPFVPKQQGSATFFKPTMTIDFPQLPSSLLLIAISGDVARYKLQEDDPHTHELKKLGYGVGDRLTAETHPFIFKT